LENDFYNEDYFDFKRLAIDERFIKTTTANCTYAYDTCLNAASKLKCIGLINEAGYGVRSGIEDFTKRTRYKYYYGICTKTKRLKKILTEFLYIDIPIFIKLDSSNEDYLVNAIGHLFRNETKRNRLMIFYNAENLSLREYGVVYRLVTEVKRHAGVVLSINGNKFLKLQNWSTKHPDISNFLTCFTWEELPPPDSRELGQHCVARGILGKKIIDRLINRINDFRILNMEINKIRDLLAKKGYLKLEP
jgi:hypothetical protein